MPMLMDDRAGGQDIRFLPGHLLRYLVQHAHVVLVEVLVALAIFVEALVRAFAGDGADATAFSSNGQVIF